MYFSRAIHKLLLRTKKTSVITDLKQQTNPNDFLYLQQINYFRSSIKWW